MGMRLTLCLISSENLNKVLADPQLVWRVIASDDSDACESALPKGRGLPEKLFGRAPTPTDDLMFSDGEIERKDLDKAWHGIHYLLTGTAFEGDGPISYLLTGGDLVGDIDVGYGPARGLSPLRVQEFQRALAKVSFDELRLRFNPDEMKTLEIYPDIWDRDPAEDDTLGYCIAYFNVLRDFVDAAAANRKGLLIYII